MTPKLVAGAIAALTLCSCVTTQGPHPRAVECNTLCAQYLTTGDLQTAEDQCDLGLQFSPQYADLWVNKGIIAYNRAQYDKAKEYLIKALRYNQEQAQAYNNLGMLYMKELAYGKARENFERALRVNPDYLEARFNLALAWMALKEPVKAKKDLRTLVQIKPDLADGWAHLGQLALEEGDHATAIEHLGKATQLDPRFVAAWLVLGNAYLEAGRPCDGKDAYSTCIETDENSAECRNNIIVAERKCALQNKALEDTRQAAARTPEAEYGLALQAKEQGLLGDEERAYKRCLKVDPDFPLCHFGLFELLKGRSDTKNAALACEKFLQFANEPTLARQTATCRQFVGR